MDEAFYVIDGRGTCVLDDARHPIEKGGSIFIPKNSWHAFENADCELLLLWVVSPPGWKRFFVRLLLRLAHQKSREQRNN
jgi:mannose-6-phosphate isomerase-like protein (cupin superfamily)